MHTSWPAFQRPCLTWVYNFCKVRIFLLAHFKITSSHMTHTLVWTVTVVTISLVDKGIWMVRQIIGWLCAIWCHRRSSKTVGMDKALVMAQKARGQSPSWNGVNFLISRPVFLKVSSLDQQHQHLPELVRNAISWAPSWTYWIRISGSHTLYCNQSSRWFWRELKSEKHCARTGSRLISLAVGHFLRQSMGQAYMLEQVGTLRQEMQDFLSDAFVQVLNFYR